MFTNILQLAYITNDIDLAVKQFQTEEDIPEFAVFKDFELNLVGGNKALINVALAFIGDIQIEIIEGVEGDVAIYRESLTEQFQVKSHHICSSFDTIDQYDRVREQHRVRGVDVVLEGSFGDGGVFFYADTFAKLGHYQEYVWLDEQTKAFNAQIPRFT